MHTRRHHTHAGRRLTAACKVRRPGGVLRILSIPQASPPQCMAKVAGAQTGRRTAKLGQPDAEGRRERARAPRRRRGSADAYLRQYVDPVCDTR